MKASPIVPGQSYLVTHRRTALTVSAAHPCDAICIALDHFAEVQ